VVVPILSWNKIAQRGLRFALNLSSEIEAVHVECEVTKNLRQDWGRFVEDPTRKANLPIPQLVILKSPYRYIVGPIVDHVLDLERKYPDRQIAVVVPELVERHWYHYFLHNQRAELLKGLLLLKGNQRIVLINVPWYLSE
jgi:hypothetical protein